MVLKPRYRYTAAFTTENEWRDDPVQRSGSEPILVRQGGNGTDRSAVEPQSGDWGRHE